MRIKTLKNISKIYGNYLENGCYIFNKDYTQIININNSEKIQTYANKLNFFSRAKRTLINLPKYIFVNKKITINNKEKIFEGNLVLIPSKEYGVKIFSNNKILTISDDKKYIETINNNKKIMSNIFDVPKTISLDENLIIEERVPNFKYDKEEALIYILNSYINYFKNNKITGSIINKKRNKLIEKSFTRYENIIINLEIMQHCDIWSENIIYNGNRYYIIDYENVKKEYILYDFFTFIYSEVYMNKNYKLLNNYFSGLYNEYLNQYFILLGMKFDKEKLKDYYISFLYYFCLNRFNHYNSIKLSKELYKIKKHINNLGMMNK